MNQVVVRYLKLFGDFNTADVFSGEDLEYIEYHLTRQEEHKVNERDVWGNWESKFSKYNTNEPFLDQFVISKLKDKNINRRKIWPDNKSFGVILSHDVDRIESYSPISHVRNIKKRLAAKPQINQRFSLYLNLIKTKLKGTLFWKRSDVLWHYEVWQRLEESYGFKSTYFFYVLPSLKDISVYDCDYDLNDYLVYNNKRLKVREYIQLLSSLGFEIGLHGSYNTHKNVDLFRSQKKKLESIIHKSINVTRQHYLHYDIKTTPGVHMSNDIQVDSTVGFNTSVGFRAGTAFPFFMFSAERELLEIPLILMDSSMFLNSEITEAGAKEVILNYIKLVEEVGGCLTVNFHPDYFIREDMFNAYKYLLDEISKRNSAVMNFSEVYKIINKVCAG